jgi:hypothetical protein
VGIQGLFVWVAAEREVAGARQLVRCKNVVWQSAFRMAGGNVADAKSMNYPYMLKMLYKYYFDAFMQITY